MKEGIFILLLQTVATVALESSNTHKLGECPATSAMSSTDANILTDNCDRDIDCAYELKCCPNNYGKMRCVDPAASDALGAIELNQCPRVTFDCPFTCDSTPPESLCQNACVSEQNCPPGELCCLNRCGKFHCYRTVETVRPGTCPARSFVGSSCTSTCDNDEDCPDGNKCCPTTCTVGGKDTRACSKTQETIQNQAVVQEERLGQCPVTTGLNGCSLLTNCVFDGQCGSGQKCCRVSTGGCPEVDVCLQAVEDVNSITVSCPLKANVGGMSYHECNDRTTCKAGLICCSNSYGKGRCIEPLSTENLARLSVLVKEGVCDVESRYFCGTRTTCGGENEDVGCPGTEKCCKDSGGNYCCQPVTKSYKTMANIGVAKSNTLVARTYLMPFNYFCANIVDRKINVTGGIPITGFQFMMLPMQDLMHDVSQFIYPNLRLQLWSPSPPVQGQVRPRYSLICEKKVTRPESLPRQLLYEYDVSQDECFRNPMSTDKVGFTFDLYNDGKEDRTVIPVPYDYENADDKNSGRTDFRLFGCKDHVLPGQEVVFTDSAGFPGRWSFGVRQGSLNQIP